jgi:hypothetical protein
MEAYVSDQRTRLRRSGSFYFSVSTFLSSLRASLCGPALRAQGQERKERETEKEKLMTLTRLEAGALRAQKADEERIIRK